MQETIAQATPQMIELTQVPYMCIWTVILAALAAAKLVKVCDEVHHASVITVTVGYVSKFG